MKWFGKPLPFWTVSRIILFMSVLIVIIFFAMIGWRYQSVVKLNRELLNSTEKRKQSEEARRESEIKLRTISTSAQDAIILMDDKGDVSYWNPAAEKIFGYSSHEIEGRYFHKIIGPERYYELFRNSFETFKKNGQGSAIGRLLELEALRKDGTEFPIELSLSSV